MKVSKYIDSCDILNSTLDRRLDIIMEGVMLNEERVGLMTRAAVCYQKQEKQAMRINEYYKKDYISYNLIKAVFAFTLAYVIVAAMVVLCNIDALLVNEGNRLIIYLVMIVGIYIVAVLFFTVIAYYIFMNKYKKARSDVKEYHQLLTKLNILYKAEEVQNSKEGSL